MKTILAKPSTGLYPVPVILVTARDGEGNDNVITLAWNGVISSDPPSISISVRPSRHTHPMLLSNKVFGVNIPTRAQLEIVDYIGTHSGSKVDKFSETGLTRFEADIVSVPLIKDCPVNLECRIIETFEQGTHTVFFGEVIAEHVSNEYLIDGTTIDHKKADPILYCSGKGYFSLGDYQQPYGFSLKQDKE